MLKNNEFSGKGDSYKKIFQPRPAAASTAKYDKLVEKRRI